MKYVRIIIFLNFILFFSSCSSMKEGFSNQKRNNSDEFLVEKKSPLITPPDYNDLPVPSSNDKPLNDNNAIKSFCFILPFLIVSINSFLKSPETDDNDFVTEIGLIGGIK